MVKLRIFVALLLESRIEDDNFDNLQFLMKRRVEKR
jgi:hypothetical protein